MYHLEIKFSNKILGFSSENIFLKREELPFTLSVGNLGHDCISFYTSFKLTMLLV